MYVLSRMAVYALLLYCIVWCCIVMSAQYGIVWFCIMWCGIGVMCLVLDCLVLNVIVRYGIVVALCGVV